MSKIKVAVNGLPGKMAWAVAEAVVAQEDMELFPLSLTGPEVMAKGTIIGGVPVKLILPDKREEFLVSHRPDVVVDFTTPAAINDNVVMYTAARLSFVLGTTGGDLEMINEKVSRSFSSAIIAPNMAKEIVAFQAMVESMARKFPGLFEGYSLKIEESHQSGKKDTSGTAKAMIASFNELGIPFSVSEIKKHRTEDEYIALGIPPEYWSGHGWHTYTMEKPDGSVFFQFTHNVNGRQAYIDGALAAIRFLYGKIKHGVVAGKIFSMEDVLRRRGE